MTYFDTFDTKTVEISRNLTKSLTYLIHTFMCHIPLCSNFSLLCHFAKLPYIWQLPWGGIFNLFFPKSQVSDFLLPLHRTKETSNKRILKAFLSVKLDEVQKHFEFDYLCQVFLNKSSTLSDFDLCWQDGHNTKSTNLK